MRPISSSTWADAGDEAGLGALAEQLVAAHRHRRRHRAGHDHRVPAQRQRPSQRLPGAAAGGRLDDHRADGGGRDDPVADQEAVTGSGSAPGGHSLTSRPVVERSARRGRCCRPGRDGRRRTPAPPPSAPIGAERAPVGGGVDAVGPAGDHGPAPARPARSRTPWPRAGRTGWPPANADHRDRAVQRLAQRPVAAYPQAQRRSGLLVDRAGRARHRQVDEAVQPRGPLLVAGHHEPGPDALALGEGPRRQLARVAGREPRRHRRAQRLGRRLAPQEQLERGDRPDRLDQRVDRAGARLGQLGQRDPGRAPRQTSLPRIERPSRSCDGLDDVVAVGPVAPVEVGDRPGQPEHAVEAAGGQRAAGRGACAAP